ncbi:arabinofuranosidase catalytic domain-containing protein [Serratia fonticola]|uniref:arabinofuranosidase catalytic domain-containing protein n=1 Tax=Serratia fonticola TaxID=47917 RepID=UPI003AABD618
MANSTSIIAVDAIFSNYVGKGNFLGSYPDAVAAYSMRTLSAGRYVGPLVRVRRGSDSVEQDFYARAGSVNVDEVKAFVGSASGFVTVWYDQSGNGLHAFQPVVASQPMIAKNGVMVLFNGKSCVMFDGTDDCLQLPEEVVIPFRSGDNDLSIFSACTPKNGSQAFTVLSMAARDSATAGSNDLLLIQANASYAGSTRKSAGISTQKYSELSTPDVKYAVGAGASVSDVAIVIGITRELRNVTINDARTTATAANIAVGTQNFVIGTIGALRRGVNGTIDPGNVDSKVAELIIYKKSYQPVITNIISNMAEYYAV